jgi:hypothetical protein
MALFFLGQFIFLSEHIKPLALQLSLDPWIERTARLAKIPVDAKLSILYLSTALTSLACIIFNFACPPQIRNAKSREDLNSTINAAIKDGAKELRGPQLIEENISWINRSKANRMYQTMYEQVQVSAGDALVASAQELKMAKFLVGEIDRSIFWAPVIAILIGISIVFTSALSLYEVARVFEYVAKILFSRGEQ